MKMLLKWLLRSTTSKSFMVSKTPVRGWYVILKFNKHFALKCEQFY